MCELDYQATKWDTSRRMIVVRQQIQQRPKATGKILSLFEDYHVYRNYPYSAYVTNLVFGPAEVWRLYRGRGDAENRIKELKQDFDFDSFNLNWFYPTEAALTFAIGAYFERIKGKLVQRIALTKKRRKWFESLWDYPIQFPVYFSNA